MLCITHLKKLEREELSAINTQFEEDCLQTIKDELLLHVLSPEEIRRNARYFLTGEGMLTRPRMVNDTGEQTEAGRQKDLEVWRMVRQLHEVYKNSKELFNTSYLFINAPFGSQNLSLDEDQSANSLQFEKMYNIMHETAEEKRRNPYKEVVVHDVASLLGSIQEFFQEFIMQTKRISIVFNGEGYSGNECSKGSLVMYLEKKAFSMEDFVEEIKKIWMASVTARAGEHARGIQSSESEECAVASTLSLGDFNSMPQEHVSEPHSFPTVSDIPPLPANVSIIFPQCQSHEFNSSKKLKSDVSELQVFTLTSARRNLGQAKCRDRFVPHLYIPGINRYLVDSTHVELVRFARHNKDNEHWEAPVTPLQTPTP